jgi:signal transduction histidine kinase
MIPALITHFNDSVEISHAVALELKLDCIISTFSLFPSIWYTMEIEEFITIQQKETEKAVSDMMMKKSFLRKVCHVDKFMNYNFNKELRTPFSSILGYLELLDLDENIKKHRRSKEYVTNAIQSCSHLVSMLNSVLSLEKLEAQDGPKFANHNLEKLFQSVWAVAAGFFSKSKLDFTMIIKKGSPEQIHGNELFLRQTLINLVHNSVNFDK